MLRSLFLYIFGRAMVVERSGVETSVAERGGAELCDTRLFILSGAGSLPQGTNADSLPRGMTVRLRQIHLMIQLRPARPGLAQLSSKQRNSIPIIRAAPLLRSDTHSILFYSIPLHSIPTHTMTQPIPSQPSADSSPPRPAPDQTPLHRRYSAISGRITAKASARRDVLW